MQALLQDWRYGARILWKAPGFTATAVLTLALGIGANTAIFSLMEAVLLRQLPVPRPEQLVFVNLYGTPRKSPVGFVKSGYGGALSYTAFRQLRSHPDAFASLFGFAPFGFDAANISVTINGQAGLVDGVMVTGGYFSGLGAPPILGREISEQDEQPGRPRVAVLGYDYWARSFGRDPGVVGRSMIVNGAPCAIVGVAPAGFSGVIPGHKPDLWVSLGEERGLFPFSSQPPHGKGPLEDDAWFWLQVMGRLKPGASLVQAGASLDVPFQQLLQGVVNSAAKPEDLPHLTLVPGGRGMDGLRRQYTSPLALLQVMVAMLLLIGCANLAALLLARAAGRRSEMGVRMALGASRARLIRQLLVESLMLAALGGAGGLLVAAWGARLLLGLISGGTQQAVIDAHLDLQVLAFTSALAMLTSLLFGLAPALWPGQNPVGRRFSFGDRFDAGKAFEVIGVAQDAKFSGVRERLRPTAYFPYTHTPWRLGQLHFEVKAAGDPAALVTAIRGVVRDTDPNLPPFDLKTQAEQVDQSLVEERLFARLSSFFGVLGLLLASTGLYGLLAYSVSQQTHEIGIRLALGAQPGDILRLVLKGALWTTGAGIAAGAAASLGLARFVRGYLFGVEPHDPWTLAGVALLLAGVALLACYLPARRATRVDPMVALRYE